MISTPGDRRCQWRGWCWWRSGRVVAAVTGGDSGLVASDGGASCTGGDGIGSGTDGGDGGDGGSTGCCQCGVTAVLVAPAVTALMGIQGADGDSSGVSGGDDGVGGGDGGKGGNGGADSFVIGGEAAQGCRG